MTVNRSWNKIKEEYAEFIHRLRERIGEGLSKGEAVRVTMDECIREGILADLLRKERARMENILIQGLTDEEQRELYEMQCRRGREEGREEGRKEGESRIIKMNQYLIQQNRFDDLKRASEDRDYRAAILEEMNQK